MSVTARAELEKAASEFGWKMLHSVSSQKQDPSTSLRIFDLSYLHYLAFINLIQIDCRSWRMRAFPWSMRMETKCAAQMAWQRRSNSGHSCKLSGCCIMTSQDMINRWHFADSLCLLLRTFRTLVLSLSPVARCGVLQPPSLETRKRTTSVAGSL